jgi:hypothetical protein
MRDPTTDFVGKELTETTIAYLSDLAAMLPAGDQIKTGKRGRPPQRRDRHVQIADAVAMLVVDAGLNPTRSHFERRLRSTSACSIVTAALAQLSEHLDERTVEGIWDQHRRWALDLARAFYGIIRDELRIIRDPEGRSFV